MDRDTLALYQKMFNVTQEERDDIIRVLAQDESEAVGSMGDDTPMPVLSHKVRSLYDYFRQQFAQVTNPPIDPLRETIVMSLQTQIGPECNIFVPAPEHARQIVLGSPILSQRKLRQILALEEVTHEFLDLQYEPAEGLQAPSCACARRPRARCATASWCCCCRTAIWCKGRLPAHALLVTGAVHQHLVKHRPALQVQPAGRDRHGARAASFRLPHRLRRHRRVSLHGLPGAVRDDAQGPREARLRGAPGARAQLPRRACARACSRSCRRWASPPSPATAARSCSRSWGSSDEVVELCFTGTESRVQGADFADLEADRVTLAARAWNPREPIGAGRTAQVRARRGVPHVQPGRDRSAAGGGDVRRLRALPPVRRPRERPPGVDVPRPAGA